MTFKYKSASFARDGANGTLKFEMATVTSDGDVLTPEAQAFKTLAHKYGFEPEDLGTVFRYQGTDYRITGLKTRRPKFPISAERVSDGRGFKFPVFAVKGNRPMVG